MADVSNAPDVSTDAPAPASPRNWSAAWVSSRRAHLFVDSTLAKPDVEQICFCVSLVVYDLILEGETAMAVRSTQPPVPENDCSNSSSSSSSNSDPYSHFRPREIFQLPSKRRRSPSHN